MHAYTEIDVRELLFYLISRSCVKTGKSPRVNAADAANLLIHLNATV